ncbi:L,D-transpeptidase family protein [Sphingomonas sp. PB2P19]|uniref:L,D-transpeptidase family protein n=1 Tax=Sphingomonas rhamnosi TaxID=3096156 RepID=UPI002FC90C6B
MNRATSFAFALMLVAAAPPAAVSETIEEDATALPRNRFVWNDTGTGEPLSIVISLSAQRAFVYRGAQMIGATTISSGRDGKVTPLGTYPILQKNAVHRSTIYGSSMPYMQRLTWDGIAIHAGNNPGFPDSHGCIRVPAAFAKKLFAVTGLGTPVTVTNDFEDRPAGADVPWVGPSG